MSSYFQNLGRVQDCVVMILAETFIAAAANDAVGNVVFFAPGIEMLRTNAQAIVAAMKRALTGC